VNKSYVLSLILGGGRASPPSEYWRGGASGSLPPLPSYSTATITFDTNDLLFSIAGMIVLVLMIDVVVNTEVGAGMIVLVLMIDVVVNTGVGAGMIVLGVGTIVGADIPEKLHIRSSYLSPWHY
jgi:hypothetical protein